MNVGYGASSLDYPKSAASLQATFTIAGSRPSKLSVSNGANRNSGEQRNPTFGTSQEFLSSSPDRSFPMLVQFGHSSVTETREQSSDGGRQFRGVAVGCAAEAVIQVTTADGSSRPEAAIGQGLLSGDGSIE